MSPPTHCVSQRQKHHNCRQRSTHLPRVAPPRCCSATVDLRADSRRRDPHRPKSPPTHRLSPRQKHVHSQPRIARRKRSLQIHCSSRPRNQDRPTSQPSPSRSQALACISYKVALAIILAISSSCSRGNCNLNINRRRQRVLSIGPFKCLVQLSLIQSSVTMSLDFTVFTLFTKLTVPRCGVMPFGPSR